MRLRLLSAALLAASPLLAQEAGSVALFNGKDLNGWVNVNCAPGTWTVASGEIVCSGVPTGVLRTDRQYENFVLECEWLHEDPKGNAGIFVWSDPLTAKGQPFTRSVEVQVMVGQEGDWYTSDGDVFPIHGATMRPDNPRPNGGQRSYPTERRMKPHGEWNHYRIVCDHGAIALSVNGKIVTTGRECSPRKGYICLESEGTPVRFRNLHVRELPPDPALPPEHVCAVDAGFVRLYNGVDLAGWKVETAHAGHWSPANWCLETDGTGPEGLWTEKSYADFELICDWRWTREPVATERPVILPSGDYETKDGKPLAVKVQDAGDSGIYLRGSSKSQVNIWCWPCGSGEVYGYRTDAGMPPAVRAGVTPKVNADAPLGQWNRFLITMRGDRLTVVLNGQTVLEEAQLPGVAEEGPIALQNHGAPVQFANLYVRELQ